MSPRQWCFLSYNVLFNNFPASTTLGASLTKTLSPRPAWSRRNTMRATGVVSNAPVATLKLFLRGKINSITPLYTPICKNMMSSTRNQNKWLRRNYTLSFHAKSWCCSMYFHFDPSLSHCKCSIAICNLWLPYWTAQLWTSSSSWLRFHLG